MDDNFLRSVGGKRISLGNGTETWSFGWVPPQIRTTYQHAEVGRAEAEMPKFTPPPIKGDPEGAYLYVLWKDPLVVQANGSAFTGIKQVTGSCVGAGGGTCWMTLACVEAVRLGDPETPLVPFWLLPYGRSRFYLGDRSPGEGSTGGTFAKAAREDGVVAYNHSGLPQPTDNDGMRCWGNSVEMAWSDGDARQTMDLLSESRKHLVRTTAKCSSHSDVRAALINGYPCTAASMYAHNGGTVQSDPPVLVGKKQGSWSHQMSIIGWMKHPKLGDLFYLMNQWGQGAHKKNPDSTTYPKPPDGGVWISAADVDTICRDEVFTFSQFNGFPAPDWEVPWIL